MEMMEMLVIAALMICVCGGLGLAGAVWVKACRPEWLEQCGACHETVKDRCKAAMHKAKGVAQSWFGGE